MKIVKSIDPEFKPHWRDIKYIFNYLKIKMEACIISDRAGELPKLFMQARPLYKKTGYMIFHYSIHKSLLEGMIEWSTHLSTK